MLRQLDKGVRLQSIPKFAKWTYKSSGLKADERAVTAHDVSVATISTGTAFVDDGSIVKITGATPSAFQNEINKIIQNADVKVVKIGQ